jgi:carbon storage regulator CsrA
MLVLARRQTERIIITNDETGEQITINVLRCDHNRSVLGIEAPNVYRIDREEIIEAE